MENSIDLVGFLLDPPTYSHEFGGVSYYVCMVKSEYVRNKVISPSYIRLYLPESMVFENEIAPRTVVHVTGHLINSNHDGHRDISVSVDSIENCAVDTPRFNQIKLTGIITKFFTNDSNFANFVNFLISLPDPSTNKRSVSLRVVAWSKLASLIFDTMDIGDTVTVLGSISNSYYDPSEETSKINIADRVIISEVYCTACTRND